MVKLYQTTERDYLKRAGVRGDERLFVAVSNGALLGYCKYRLAGDRVVLLDLFEQSGDMTMADALVRAAVAAHRDHFDTVECGEGGLLPAYRSHTGLYIDGGRAPVEVVLQRHCGL